MIDLAMIWNIGNNVVTDKLGIEIQGADLSQIETDSTQIATFYHPCVEQNHYYFGAI